MNIRRLVASASALAVVAAGVIAAPASAYTGDWVINGQFERTTAPSFTPGFNPNDVDTLLAQFDNRSKTFSVRLDFFERPGNGIFVVNIGKTTPSGSCDGSSMTVNITQRNTYVAVPRTVDSRVWVPDAVELIHTAVGDAPTGVGWRFDGIDANGYRWIRIIPGHYSTSPTTTTDTVLDPDHHARVGNLFVNGVDGNLEQEIVVDNDSLSWTFSFAHPYLSNIAADCAMIQIPGRRTPLTVLSAIPPVLVPPVVAQGGEVISPKINASSNSKAKAKKKKTKQHSKSKQVRKR